MKCDVFEFKLDRGLCRELSLMYYDVCFVGWQPHFLRSVEAVHAGQVAQLGAADVCLAGSLASSIHILAETSYLWIPQDFRLHIKSCNVVKRSSVSLSLGSDWISLLDIDVNHGSMQ